MSQAGSNAGRSWLEMLILVLTLRGVIPVVCKRLIGRELQSITQLSVSNR